MKLPFLKPAWQQQNPDKRLAGLQTLDPGQPDQLEALKQLASSDPDAAVRAAALGRVEDIHWLFANLSVAGFEQHLVALLIRVAAPDPAQLAPLDQLPPQGLQTLACRAVSADLREMALSQLAGDEWLVAVASESEFAETRHAAAARLSQEASLQQVWQVARDKDKSLARDLGERLEHLKQQREQAAAASRRAGELAVAMHQLSHAAWTPQYNAKFAALVSQWQDLEARFPDLPSQGYRDSAIRAEAVVNAHRRVAEAMRRREQLLEGLEQLAGQLAAQPAAEAEVSRALDSWQQLRRDWVDCDADCAASELQQQEFDRFGAIFVGLGGWRQQGQAAWRALDQACRQAIAGEPLEAEPLQQLVGQLKALRPEFRLPGLAPLPLELQQAQQQLQQHIEQLSLQLQQHSERLETVGKRLAAIRKVVKSGNLQKASAMRRKLDAKLQQLDSRQQLQVAERLASLDTELAAMHDWKAFATLPKFDQYCIEMEKLADMPLPPARQVEQVRQLQEAWKALKMAAPEQLWQRFQQAGHRAWEPCEAWFEQQEQQRLANQQVREALLAQLQALLDSTAETPDWQELRKSWRDLSANWRDSGSAPRGEHSRQQKRWSKLSERLQTAFQAQYLANHAQKLALVEQAEALASQPDQADAAARMKQLQSQWRDAGLVDPKDERQLWKRFKAAGDRLFQFDRERNQQQQTQRDQQVAQLGDRLERLSRQLTDENQLDTAQLELLRADLQQLQPQHKGDRAAQQLLRDWRELENRLIQARDLARRDKQQQLWEKVLQVALGKLPPESLPAGLQGLEGQNGDAPDDVPARLGELRIRLALVLGEETDPQDAPLRMQLQMQRLQQAGVGHAASRTTDDQVHSLLCEWLQLGGQCGDTQQAQQLAQMFRLAAQRGVAVHG